MSSRPATSGDLADAGRGCRLSPGFSCRGSGRVRVESQFAEDLEALGLVLLQAHCACGIPLTQHPESFHQLVGVDGVVAGLRFGPGLAFLSLGRGALLASLLAFALLETLASQGQQGRTFKASGPFRPGPMSNSTS